MESLQHLASQQDDSLALTSRKILQTVHQQIEKAVTMAFTVVKPQLVIN